MVLAFFIQHAIPSPVEITKLATQYILQEKRQFPNHELTLYQITHAIKSLGLDPVTIFVRNNAKTLQANIYAYLSAGIPLLLLLNSPQGGHAVAVTGYSVNKGLPTRASTLYPEDFIVTSTCVDKIYVHDDQIGPFARAELFGSNESLGAYEMPPKELRAANEFFYSFSYEILIAPVYHKIRIGYDTILRAVYSLHNAFMHIIAPGTSGVHEAFRHIVAQLGTKGNLHWDIYLSTSNQFKEKCRDDPLLAAEERARALQKEIPRFIWIADAKCKDNVLFSLVFDATDIAEGRLLVHDVEYNFPFIPALRELFEYEDTNGTNLPPYFKTIKAWVLQL